MSKKKGIILILISALMFGSYGVWSRLIGDFFGVFYQAWTRGLIISIILPILLRKKEIIPIAKKDYGWLAVFLFFTSLTQAPIFYAFNHMDIGSATLLFFVSMLLTMYIVGFLFLKEKFTKIKTISFLLASLGIYFVFSFSMSMFTLLAASMAILNGIASGGETSFSKKLSGNYSTLYLTWLCWIIIIITNLPVSLFFHEIQYIPSFEIVRLFQIGFGITGLFGFRLIIEGLKVTEASVGGLIGLLEIVFSILFGIIIFHEGLSGRVLLGGSLIILASALPNISKLIEARKIKYNNINNK